jgi:hypothetical protein
MRHSLLLTALLLAAVLLLAATQSRAQMQPPAPEAVAEKTLHDLSGRIALTPQETTALRPILTEAARKRQSLVRAKLADRPNPRALLGLRDELRAQARETEARLAAVLPPEKMTVVRAYLEERRQEARARLAAARRGG